MTARAVFKQHDINRAFKGARAAGYDHVRIKILPDGTMDVIASDAPQPEKPDWRAQQPLYRDN